MVSNLQEKMFREMEQKQIFEKSKKYAFEYADNARERHVFPDSEALKNLENFIDELPDSIGDASAILQYLGKEGVDELLYGFHQRAVQIRDELVDAGFRVLNDVVFNQVLVACENDDITSRTLQYIQKSGVCWAGGSTWRGKTVIRISICSWATTDEDITLSVQAFVSAKNKVVMVEKKVVS